VTSRPETLADKLTCTECGRRPLPGEQWSLRFADLGEVAVYCPKCDERESAVAARRPTPTTAAVLVVFAAVMLVMPVLGRAAPPPDPDSIVIRGDVQIGRFRVQRDGTLDAAIRAFGPPTSLRRGSSLDCTARWRHIGLRIGFYNLGGQDPCRRQYGYFSNATMVGRQWVTARGLRLGDPSRKLHALYAPRRFTGSWAWLLRRWSPYGEGAYYPGLAAKIMDGWVTAFRIRYAAGGD
jgi:hypothetical protein